MNAPSRITARDGRYQVTLCLGLVQTHVEANDPDAAQTLLDDFAAEHVCNSDAHGGIWDRYAVSTIADWRGGPRRLSGEALFLATIGKPWWPAVKQVRA